MNRPVFSSQTSAKLEGEVIFYRSQAVVTDELLELWAPSLLQERLVHRDTPKRDTGGKHYAPPVSPVHPCEVGIDYAPPELPVTPHEDLIEQAEPELREEQSKLPESWRFGLRSSFLKAVDSIDRKLQGRVLQAIADIATAPLANRGDTIKPLSGEMKGYWRYRIGNFRLVYYPDEATHTITVCEFASRGSVYD